MKRRTKRTGVNNSPDISLYGDNLDRLLAGLETPELRRERYKTSPIPVAQPQPLESIRTNNHPVVLVMYRDKCDCGTIASLLPARRGYMPCLRPPDPRA
jgi:hypothetical protein